MKRPTSGAVVTQESTGDQAPADISPDTVSTAPDQGIDAAVASDGEKSAAPGDVAAPTFNPDHEWPSKGGSYVRQPDGTLTRED